MVKLTDKLVLGRARAPTLDAVKNLNCWGSGLTDISLIMKMHNVEVVNASANSIDSLQAFSHCTNLRELYLRKNSIGNLNEILYLKELRELRILWLSGNPCCDKLNDEKYRFTVIKALPMLTKLDNVAITIEELEKAKREGDDIELPEVLSEDTKKNKQGIPPEQPSRNGDEDTAESGRKNKSCTSERKVSQETVTASSSTSETQGSYAVYETNELRKQLGLRPLPQPSGLPIATRASTQRRLGQSTASINVLTAALALVKDLDEGALLTLQDAIHDRLRLVQGETVTISQENSETARSSGLSNGSLGKAIDGTIETV